MKKNNRSESRSDTKGARLAVALLMLQLGWLALPRVHAATQDAPEDRRQDVQQKQDGSIKAKGAFTCDFALPGDFPFSQVAPLIERDRMYMAERPGMQRKQIPMRIDFSN